MRATKFYSKSLAAGSKNATVGDGKSPPIADRRIMNSHCGILSAHCEAISILLELIEWRLAVVMHVSREKGLSPGDGNSRLF